MLIWRNLEPQALGRLLTSAAQSFAADRRARREQASMERPSGPGRQGAPGTPRGGRVQSPASVFSNTTWRSSKPQRS